MLAATAAAPEVSGAQVATQPSEQVACAHHVRVLAEFSHALQAPATLAEALTVIGEFLPRLFHVPGGTLQLFRDGGPLRTVCEWGRPPTLPALSSAEIRALRRGEPAHAVRRDAVQVPLSVNDHPIGLLSLACPASEAEALLGSAYTASAVEEIALVIGNMRERDCLREQSVRDPLTNLYNRRYLEESMERELARAGRTRLKKQTTALAVLMIDVDHFKRFNDDHGHEAGDLVLAAIGDQLRHIVRASDIASRYGGEEFVVVLLDVTPKRALARAEQIRSAVEAHRLGFHDVQLPPVTISIGIAMYPLHGNSVESLLRTADAALYTAKHRGRNLIHCASADLTFPSACSVADDAV